MVRGFVKRHRAQRHALEPSNPSSWLAGPQVVLRQETALELGGPRSASCFALLWDDAEDAAARQGRVSLVGPDLSELPPGAAPLALVVMAGGPPVPDESLHDHLCGMRDAVYGVHLRGVMARLLPSQQSVWYRLSADAVARGVDARVLGSALVRAVAAAPGVEAAEVLLVTSGAREVEQLAEAAQLAAGITEALGAMDADPEMDCEGCAHQAVCDLVDELREAHALRARFARR